MGEPCQSCRYWKATAIDALLELAAANQRLAEVDEDEVERVAAERLRFYTLLGGTTLTLGAFKSKTRHLLKTGEWI